ncbi:FitA-like ribbon-helix-helix domain-containing protein [Tepidimonas taiwanensis]|uniref:FitA-like ribbon-helix-helix domain-containing protein n=1 Tax=Tepidimonas taiwanensis TaxID=307486 RepID=UPI0005B85B88|nr:plasmid stabilization protein [Tepidimonas taiwanensis]MCX7693335.1 plasmid stabilization protein [Tepidimonas taiwanensis]MDM7463503.1 plasmid stabilization protein [Tepidimonas taiwanensis]
MSALTVRNLDDAVKARLRVRAARHGVSMEEEVRRILREAVANEPGTATLGQRLKSRFEPAASADFAVPARRAPRTPPAWDDAP